MRRDMIAHQFQGEVASALARCRRTLKAAGFELSQKIGRYHPFESTQTLTHGVRVTRVGCSSTIALHGHLGRYAKSEDIRALEARALEALRAAGLPFDDRGWLECHDAQARAREAKRGRRC